ncbi:MAG TPA: RNA polymerase sporulation sigma factor SigH [Coriobacteriia bacterium]|nr:RNA polymerase sporulation sigma factor SigH [Coriobacteriia bacterium]
MGERMPATHRMPGDRGGDVALVMAAQKGDQLASCELVKRYRSLIRCKARSYYLVGADRDDIIQEGMIGLYKAIRDYDPTRQASFHSFAELCVTRQIITAVKSSTRRKHAPLNGYVSLSRSATTDEDGERLLSDILAAREVCDPAEIVIGAWETDFIRTNVVDALSPFETGVLRLYTAGRSYQEIADRLGRHTKAVDNALQRVKRKMETQIQRCRAH